MSAESAKVGYWDHNITEWAKSCYDTSRKGLLDRMRSSVNARMEVALGLLERRLSPGGVLLDLGCGAGQFAIEAVGRGLVDRSVAVDFSAAGIAFARDLAHDRGFDARCRFEVADAVAFPIPPDTTVVTALGLVDWLEDRQVEELFSSLAGRQWVVSYSETDNTLSELIHRVWLCERLRFFGGGVRARHHERDYIADCARLAGCRSPRFVKTARTRFGTLVHNLG